jgi:hypothetical protein
VVLGGIAGQLGIGASGRIRFGHPPNDGAERSPAAHHRQATGLPRR